MMTRLRKLIPDFLKPLLRPLYYAISSSSFFGKVIHYGFHRYPRNALYQYWREPWDRENLPEMYLEGRARSQFLVSIMKKYATQNAKILEIGCSVGRNLDYLFQSGFKNLEGIEISEKAVQLLKQSYPEMASHTKIYNIAVEEIIGQFRDCEFDIVFTMAVLEHIHTSSEWVFSEIARITKSFLITVEDEMTLSWRCFPRNYKKIFELLGMNQIQEINCIDVSGLGRNFVARIFKKAQSE